MCYGIYSMDGKMQVGLMTAFVIKRFAVREAAGIFPGSTASHAHSAPTWQA